MRRRALALLVLGTGAAASGCGEDASLDVVVANPAGVTISRTELSVHEGAVGCEAVKFADVTAAELELALVDRVTLVSGGEAALALTGLSRTDPKLVVARAFAPDQSLIAVGCAEVGEVTGRATVTVTTELAAIASVGFVDRATEPSAIRLVVVDPLGRPLDAREVSWRVYGPIGSAPGRTTGVRVEADASWSASAPSCTRDGVATVHPVPPDVVGGYALQPRIAWAAERVPMLSTINFDPEFAQLGGVPGVHHPCALGRTAAGARLVCLTAPQEVSAVAGDASGELGAPQPTALPFAPVGLYAAPAGQDTDVFAIGAGGELARVFPSVATLPCVTCGAVAIDDVIALPACGDATGPKAIVHTAGPGGAELRWIDATGGTMTAFPFPVAPGLGVALRSAGCVTALDASSGLQAVVPAVALDYTLGGVTTRTRLLLDCTASGCGVVVLPLSGAGVGFTAEPTPALVTAAFDVTGVVLLRSLLSRAGSGDVGLIELARQPAAAVPQRIVSAQLDGDGLADLLWDEVVGRLPVVQLAYAREVHGAPLSALSILYKAGADLEVLDVLTGELTGDGHDDVALISSQSVTGRVSVAVLPSQTPAPATMLPDDPGCP